MTHITKDKGDIGVAETIRDLTRKGYTVFTPTISEHCPIDIIACKDNQCIRIQVKNRKNGYISNKTNWSDKNGGHTKYYSNTDFDYYAIYIPILDKVLYPSIKYGGCKIAFTLSNSAKPFYWWEDFLNFTDNAKRKSYKDFNIKLKFNNSRKRKLKSFQSRKVKRPTKKELNKLLWKVPSTKIAKQFKVSNTTISKWAKYYGLKKPGRGYWSKHYLTA